MSNLTEIIKDELKCLGADLVGFADITDLPEESRANMPVGISIILKYPKNIIEGISELPTAEYRDWYNSLNEGLDRIAATGAELLQNMGYSAIAQTRAYVGNWNDEYKTNLPQKTIATKSGLGWIGKCALLVTDEYGSMVRLSSILTDAPLTTATPIKYSRCGDCKECTNACPGGAVSGVAWYSGLSRDRFFDHIKCDETATERSVKGFGGGVTVCGKCIEICPYTRRYINSNL